MSQSITNLESPPDARSPKTSERVAHRLVRYIIENDLAEGTSLPVEPELVAALGVGRTSLREALLLLETWGVITMKPGRNGGPIVRRPRPGDLGPALALHLQFASGTLRDVIDAREALEPMTARYAATRMDTEELDELAGCVEQMRASIHNQTAFEWRNQRFHSIIAGATGSVVLHTFIDSLKAVSSRAFDVEYEPSYRMAVATAHEGVVEAIRNRDPDAAEEAMRRHLKIATDYWDRLGDLASRPMRWQ